MYYILYTTHFVLRFFSCFLKNPRHQDENDRRKLILVARLLEYRLAIFYTQVCQNTLYGILLNIYISCFPSLLFSLIFNMNYRLRFALVCNTVEPINPRYITDSFQIKTRTPSLALYIITA